MPRSGPAPRPALELTAQTVEAWLDYAAEGLKNAQHQLNRMNVFPVADADTGTNMWQTVEAARQAVHEAEPSDFASALKIAAHAMLYEAKGNSGSILAQYFRGLATAFDQVTDQSAVSSGASFATALQRANERAWTAVFSPVAGTILSVTEAAAQAVSGTLEVRDTSEVKSAKDSVGQRNAAVVDADDLGGSSPAAGESDLCEKYRAAFAAARLAVQRTATQLPALRGAGFADAGAVAWLVTFEAFGRALGVPKYSIADIVNVVSPAGVMRAAQHLGSGADRDQEVEIVARFAATQAQAYELRDRRGEDSNSIVLVGDDTEWKIHLHTSHPDEVMADLASAVELLDIAQEELPSAGHVDRAVETSSPAEDH